MYDNIDIEELREQYFRTIIYLNDEQEILNALPKSDYIAFFPVMDGVLEKIDNYMVELKEMLSGENDKDVLAYINENLESTIFKKNICLSRMKEAHLDVNILNDSKKCLAKNLVFATSDGGNVYLDKDLKIIPFEYYSVVLESLEMLERGEAKFKPFVGNEKLNGILEITPFKIRIMFKNLDKDTVFVIMARVKKSNNSGKDREEPIRRNQKTINEFCAIKEQIKDPVMKKNIINVNREIKNNIFSKLKNDGRGGRK